MRSTDLNQVVEFFRSTFATDLTRDEVALTIVALQHGRMWAAAEIRDATSALGSASGSSSATVGAILRLVEEMAAMDPATF